MKKLLFLALCLMNIASAQSIELAPGSSVASASAGSVSTFNPALSPQLGALFPSSAQPAFTPSSVSSASISSASSSSVSALSESTLSSVITPSSTALSASMQSSISSATPSLASSSVASSTSRPNFVPADGGVILYGRVDQGYGYTQQRISGSHQGVPFSIKRSDAGVRSGVMNDSMVGIRAEQSLGGGNKVFIQIEENFNGATGTPLKERGTTVIGIGG